jgi:hypothetical protein
MVFKGKHILFSNGLTDLTYRCNTCDVETKPEQTADTMNESPEVQEDDKRQRSSVVCHRDS